MRGDRQTVGLGVPEPWLCWQVRVMLEIHPFLLSFTICKMDLHPKGQAFTLTV